MPGPKTTGDIAPAQGADAERQQRNTNFVQSLERGLSVIRAFDPEHQQLTLSDVARRTDLTRATARRFLLTLTELGYVGFDGRLFSLRPRVLELGYSYMSTLTTPDVAPVENRALAGLGGLGDQTLEPG